MSAPVPKAIPSDRRRHARRASAAVATLFVPDGGATGKTVQVVDLSLKGVGFRSEDDLAFGSVHGLQLTENWLNLTARIRVLTSRKRDGGGFDVGAHFV